MTGNQRKVPAFYPPTLGGCPDFSTTNRGPDGCVHLRPGGECPVGKPCLVAILQDFPRL